MRTFRAKLSMFIGTFLAAVLALALVPGTASATHAGTATSRQLLDQCDQRRTDFCEFKPSGAISVYDGPRQLAGSGTNCTNSTAVRVIRWEATSGTTNTWGVEFSATKKIGEIYEFAIKSSYQREWSWLETAADEWRQDVAPRTRVNVFAVKQKSRVSGTWELHFGKRYYGHYYWYVNGSVEGQTRGQPWDIRAEKANPNC